MPPRVRCPHCGLERALTDADRSKPLRCPVCREALGAHPAITPTEPAARMARDRAEEERPWRRRKEDEQRDRPRRAPAPSSGLTVGVLLALVFGGVLLPAGCLAVVFVFARPITPPVPVGVSPPLPAPPNPVQGGGGAPAPAAVWDVKPDPLPRPPVKVTASRRKVTLGGDFPHIVVVPSTPGPFLTSGSNFQPTGKREVWNLATLEKVAEVKGFHMAIHGAVSPDGAYIASKLNAARVPLVVISCSDSKPVFEPQLPEVSTDYFDFAGPRQLIVGFKDWNDRAYHLFEVPTGRKLREVKGPGPGDKGSEAVSAGGRYLAYKSGAKVHILDLEGGQAAGTFAIPGEWANLERQELAFSPDGKELALLLASRGGLRILTWDLVGNRPSVDHTLPPALVSGLKTPGKYWGRHLEWLEDGSGWLVRGEVLIDRLSGAVVWRMGLKRSEADTPRHVVGSTHVARVSSPLPTEGTLELVEIRRGQIEPDPEKPPVTPPEDKGPRNIALGPDATPQPAEIDPLPAPKGALKDALLLATQPGDEVGQVLFTRPDLAQAVVVTIAAEKDAKGEKQVSVERLDLAGGKSLGKIPLFKTPYLPSLIDLSSDGTLIAVGDPRDRRRLLAWSLPEGKQVAAWMPHEKNPGVFSDVQKLTVVDGQHLLTKNLPGEVVLWKLPECKPLLTWRVFAQRALPLSPGGKYVILRGDKALHLCNLRTGELRGRFPFPAGEGQVHEFLAGCFRPDGKEFAAVLSFGTGLGPAPRRVVRWEATTGKVIDTHPTTLRESELLWCGDSALLAYWALFDLKQGVTVCYYSAMGGHAGHGSPDGRFWFTHTPKAKGPRLLSARALPDESARQLAAQLASGEVRLVLKPGMKVSVQLDFTGPPDDPEYRKRFQDRFVLEHALDTSGLIAAEGAAVKLRLSARESETGEKVQAVLTRKGGKPEKREVPRKRITCEFSLTDAEGKPLVPAKKEVLEVRDLNVTYEAKEDPLAAANRQQSKQLWEMFSSWLYRVDPPSFVARQGDREVPWPRTVDLTRAP